MNINPFFKNKGPYKIEKLLKLSNIDNKENFLKSKITDIRDLSTATKDSITFFHLNKQAHRAASMVYLDRCFVKLASQIVFLVFYF